MRCEDRESEDCKLSIAVRDTGIGMREDVLERIFDPFFQVQSGTSRLYGGTGLGLPISKRLADAMAGTLVLKANQGSVLYSPYRLICRIRRSHTPKHDICE